MAVIDTSNDYLVTDVGVKLALYAMVALGIWFILGKHKV